MKLVFKPHTLEKLAEKHVVTEDEVREAIEDASLDIRRHRRRRNKQVRYVVIGKTIGSRFLRIVLEKVYDEFVVITAFDASEADKKRYRGR
ncbi:MAG: DUF4258 domain-containing protein [Trueperaceae bacterium]